MTVLFDAESEQARRSFQHLVELGVVLPQSMRNLPDAVKLHSHSRLDLVVDKLARQ